MSLNYFETVLNAIAASGNDGTLGCWTVSCRIDSTVTLLLS